jgi:uncharacterized protein (TIGR02001 family)
MKFLRSWLVSFSGIFAMIALPARAAPFDDEKGTWTIAPAFTSLYLYRGTEIAGASFQPWIDYTIGPLSLGIWSSVAIENPGYDDSDPEIDFYGFYTFRNERDTFSIVPGFYCYTYPNAEKRNGFYSVTFEPSLAAVFSVAGVQLTPKIYYDVMLEGATYELTAALALPLNSLGTELDFSATAGTFKWDDVSADASPAVKNWGDYWMIGVAVPVQVSLRSKLTLSVTYSEGRNNFYKQGSLPREINENARAATAFSLTYAVTL